MDCRLSGLDIEMHVAANQSIKEVFGREIENGAHQKVGSSEAFAPAGNRALGSKLSPDPGNACTILDKLFADDPLSCGFCFVQTGFGGVRKRRSGQEKAPSQAIGLFFLLGIEAAHDDARVM